MILKKIFSLLGYSDIKFRLLFISIVILSLLIFIFDGLTIFTFLPLVSNNFGNTGNFNAFEPFVPDIILIYFSELNFKLLFTLFVTLILLRTLTFIFRNYIIFRLSKFAEVDTSKKIYSILLKKNYLDFYKQNLSKVMKDFRDSIAAYVMFVETSTRIIADTLIFLSFSILLFAISFKETLVIFFYFLIIMIFFNKILFNITSRFGKITNLTANQINFSIINTYKNYAQIILRNLKKKYLKNILLHVNEYSYTRLFNSFLRSNTKQFIELFVIIFVFLLFFMIEQSYQYSDLIALASMYIIAAYRLLPLVGNLVSSYIRLSSLDYGFSIIDSKVKSLNLKKNKLILKDKITKKIKFSSNLKLNNVSFKYNKNYIIKKLKLSIKKNEMIGIIGPSGEGKTTLIKILLGLIETSSGNIYIDNEKILKKNITDYRLLFSYLPQENLFVPGTIKENIAFGEDTINKKNIYKALKVTNCENFVRKLAGGINYKIIDEAKNFSSGQLQRLALARAIYFNTDIIILDEPTSALDYSAEKQFNKLLTSLKRVKTLVIISHKSKTLTSCDKIYELRGKKLIIKK